MSSVSLDYNYVCEICGAFKGLRTLELPGGHFVDGCDCTDAVEGFVPNVEARRSSICRCGAPLFTDKSGYGICLTCGYRGVGWPLHERPFGHGFHWCWFETCGAEPYDNIEIMRIDGNINIRGAADTDEMAVAAWELAGRPPPDIHVLGLNTEAEYHAFLRVWEESGRPNAVLPTGAASERNITVTRHDFWPDDHPLSKALELKRGT